MAQRYTPKTECNEIDLDEIKLNLFNYREVKVIMTDYFEIIHMEVGWRMEKSERIKTLYFLVIPLSRRYDCFIMEAGGHLRWV